MSEEKANEKGECQRRPTEQSKLLVVSILIFLSILIYYLVY
eukprot:COSAG06_NODE_51008_length_315_cov_0.416667_1_plen_40_part_01